MQEIYDRLDHIEFRQRLLFDNTPIDRLLFEYDISKTQYDNIMSLFDAMRDKIENGETVNHNAYENDLYMLVAQHSGNYHFAEGLAQTFHEERRWQEVFEHLYGDTPKFQGYFQKNR